MNIMWNTEEARQCHQSETANQLCSFQLAKCKLLSRFVPIREKETFIRHRDGGNLN